MQFQSPNELDSYLKWKKIIDKNNLTVDVKIQTYAIDAPMTYLMPLFTLKVRRAKFGISKIRDSCDTIHSTYAECTHRSDCFGLDKTSWRVHVPAPHRQWAQPQTTKCKACKKKELFIFHSQFYSIV